MSDGNRSHVLHATYPALSRPLTVLGCDRRIFIGAACVGAAAFTSFSAPVAGLLLFACGYGAGLVVTKHDPGLPAVIARSAACRHRYDPALRAEGPNRLQVVGKAGA